MNNADMPASPLDVDGCQKLEDGFFMWGTGLTKREDLYFRILAETAYEMTDGLDDSYFKCTCKAALSLADAALKELEK